MDRRLRREAIPDAGRSELAVDARERRLCGILDDQEIASRDAVFDGRLNGANHLLAILEQPGEWLAMARIPAHEYRVALRETFFIGTVDVEVVDSCLVKGAKQP